MERSRFGPTEREVAVIGQGTWYIERGDRASAIAALRRGLDLGMTHIDTAEMYGSGAAEEMVAEAIVGRRDEVFLVSKVLPQNASRSRTIAACKKSLARLKTDRLDSYLLHWRGPHPLDDTTAAFEQLWQEGKILSWGVSNFNTTSPRPAARHLARSRSGSWVRWPSLFTIPKAFNPERAAENAGAGALQLTEAELSRIDEAFPLGPRPRELPML